MGAIAGITQPHMEALVNKMLDKMAHRGPAGRAVFDVNGVTLGASWTKMQTSQKNAVEERGLVVDYVADGHFAQAQVEEGKVTLTRDEVGAAPLYYGHTDENILCFASEVKGLLEATRDVNILSPGHHYIDGYQQQYHNLKPLPQLEAKPDVIADEVRSRLQDTVLDFAKDSDVLGSWLSGGLDSSTMAALVRPHLKKLHTFAAGFQDAPDVRYARDVADYIGSTHHEVIVTFDDLLAILPEVIYHLESFDALLVRSSITNYLVAQEAAKYVPAVFSGEGADELFAGYQYLKSVKKKNLANELIDITQRLHNTALQRVDRSASAHGTVAHVAFLAPDLVDYALRIPPRYKLQSDIEKWILRKAMLKNLPKRVALRTKAKFWQGAGVKNLFAQYANVQIEDKEFDRERKLPNGWLLNSKEELLYYRIFHHHFGKLDNLSWMGRTKGAPKAS
jgi:asparagine synthase (glutamine-hydrolysing)